MDKEKLKKYAGYAGLGLLGGLLARIFGWFYATELLFGPDVIAWWFILMLLMYPFLGIIGGVLGGVIIKKNWGAILGGLLLGLTIEPVIEAWIFG